MTRFILGFLVHLLMSHNDLWTHKRKRQQENGGWDSNLLGSRKGNVRVFPIEGPSSRLFILSLYKQMYSILLIYINDGFFPHGMRK